MPFSLLCPAVVNAIELRTPSPYEIKIDQGISGIGTMGYLALGVGIPFLEGDHMPTQQALRAADAVGVSVLLAEGIKRLTGVPRPDNGAPDSFPSGHASAAFAMATVRSQFRPGQAWEWYGAATVISVSRVRLNRHRWTDVLAGAALGIAVGRLELSQSRGLGLFPVITRPTRDLELMSENSGFSPLLQPASMKFGLAYGFKF
jgi:membrane-associated phospholipid phosphatase